MNHIYEEPQFGEHLFSYAYLYSYIVKLCAGGEHLVEIGSWKGKSSAYMAVEIANSGKNIKFDCIDPWYNEANVEYSEMVYEGLYDTFLKNIEPVKEYIRPIRKTSMDAVIHYQDYSLDFVFIDGNHLYEFVYMDILKWLPKVRVGGIIGGHDWGFPPIQRAVSETIGLENIKVGYECWIYEK
jgi:predicted O-methyltransferase YrrM